MLKVFFAPQSRVIWRSWILLGGLAVVSLPAWTQCAPTPACRQMCSDGCAGPGDNLPAATQKCMATCLERCEKEAQNVNVATPKFYVLDVVYAPPGCTNSPDGQCASNGSVDYSATHSTGTKTSIQNSFKLGSVIDASVDLDVPPPTGDKPVKVATFSQNDDWSVTNANGSSESILNSASSGITLGGNGDGIDHDKDTIYVLLNPAIIINSCGATPSGANWSMGYFTNGDMVSDTIIKPTVAELKNPSKLATKVLLDKLGFTDDDYATMLKQDPFANGIVPIDPDRFIPVSPQMQYATSSVNCANQKCACDIDSRVILNDVTDETSSSRNYDYMVGDKVTVFAGVSTLSSSDTFTWTNTASSATTTGISSSAKATIPCPSPQYDGPKFIVTYWDTIYNSFLFYGISDGDNNSLLVQGHLSDSAGKNLANQKVEVRYGKRSLHTYTNESGVFKLYAPVLSSKIRRPSRGRLSVSGYHKTIRLGPNTMTDIQMKNR